MNDIATATLDGIPIQKAKAEERAEPLWGAVLSLSLGVFGLVTAEFLPASLLTPLAQDLGITEGTAGQAVTATAVVAAIAAPTMAIATRKIDRRHVMIGLSLLLVVSSLLAATAWSLPSLLFARVLLGVALGGFWSMSAAIAMRLVPSEVLPRAMSIILTGVSVATVCAAPVGAYVGDVWGWRSAFIIAAGVGLVTLIVQFATLPKLPPISIASFGALRDVSRNPMIRVGLLLVILTASGHFAGFTYFRAFLEQVPALGIETISLVLLAFGIGGFFGNLAGGFMAERSLRSAVTLAPLLIAISALALLLAGSSAGIAGVAIAAWGFAFGAVPVGVQTWMVRAAPDQAESAGGLMVATFQVAIALGAVFGGVLVDTAGVNSAFIYSGAATLLAAIAVACFGRKHAS
ncbi:MULTISPECIES: MFS transporter [Aminobacter]|jgi:DHA1 family purine ribonucleoside efflux pump-like MFS transporter|uniref:Transporter n=1 Tax=Aminobacter aminovorans TaxID=83263 RepID=A0AAC8YJA6_AMIAI|nr:MULTISPECIES: MFS transporter [Aminobacter]AMS39068.1 Transporter [Aminobacter aminovorans]MBB3706898.1 DHA1 family purine ribonucleoside efflux pump-like MFS transporter [Aminobacter aminovorans]QOF73604.1 MFS transporter [Aminobacter sp. SR38]